MGYMLQTADDVKKALSELKEKRGYLLPHHGLLAVAEPELLAAYDATYTAMTLTPRALSERDKEIVWLTILTSTNEAIATHHIDRLIKSGGTEADLDAAVALAAWSEGAAHFRFVEDNWSPHLTGYNAVTRYRRGLTALIDAHPVDTGVAEISLAAAHQCHRRWGWVKEHIKGAYQCRVDERAIAEALSLAMFPGGVPNFVDACGFWRDLILAGEVSATVPYQAWATMTGQGGFDEAVGVEAVEP